MGPAGMGPAICEYKIRLLKAYSLAFADSDRATKVLSSFVGVLSGPEYKEIRVYVEESRGMMDKARALLDTHLAEHGR